MKVCAAALMLFHTLPFMLLIYLFSCSGPMVDHLSSQLFALQHSTHNTSQCCIDCYNMHGRTHSDAYYMPKSSKNTYIQYTAYMRVDVHIINTDTQKEAHTHIISMAELCQASECSQTKCVFKPLSQMYREY